MEQVHFRATLRGSVSLRSGFPARRQNPRLDFATLRTFNLTLTHLPSLHDDQGALITFNNLLCFFN